LRGCWFSIKKKCIFTKKIKLLSQWKKYHSYNHIPCYLFCSSTERKHSRSEFQKCFSKSSSNLFCLWWGW